MSISSETDSRVLASALILKSQGETTAFNDLKAATDIHQQKLSRSLKRLQTAKLLWKDPVTEYYHPIHDGLDTITREYVVKMLTQFDTDFHKAKQRSDYTGQVEALRALGPAGAALGLPLPVIPEFKEKIYAKRGKNFTGKRLSDDKILAYKSRIMKILGTV